MASCFVVQGFGEKTDYQQSKVFNLDASYEVIKEAVTEAGLRCYRGDELPVVGLIEQHMYEELLRAELVIADITTLNFNAAYELGVRLALRPHRTIVVAEDGINFPFDVNHVRIHTYRHMGDDLRYRDARKFKKQLVELIGAVMGNVRPDSPVYRFLDELPREGFIERAVPLEAFSVRGDSPDAGRPRGDPRSLREMIDAARAHMDAGRFGAAIAHWQRAREVSRKDDYITQQLALAVYKSELPTARDALSSARALLGELEPRQSYDPETLGLWAAVHKRLFEQSDRIADLEEALFAVERGFFLKNDHYNGINLAFLLDVKASRSEPPVRAELHAVAAHVRRRLIPVCERLLAREGEDALEGDARYWVLATMYEAHVGLALDERVRWEAQTQAASTKDWMWTTTAQQVETLEALLA